MTSDFAEMKAWVRFGPDDAARLKRALPIVEPHLARIIDLFYAEIERHLGSRAVMSGPAQIERLKGSLRVWLREVFRGPHDDFYAVRRQRIGHRHVEVGLPDRYMYTAMHLIQAEVSEVLLRELDEPTETLASFRKVCSIDLALMTGTYVQSRERQQFDSLQSLLVEHLRLAVLLVDDFGVVRSATRATARLMTGHEVVGQRWHDALPEGLVEAADLRAQVKRALERRREVSLPRVDLDGDDGARSFRIHVLPLRHDLASFMVQIEELTDALALEARLRRSESLAQLGALSAAVAHELRNPLAGISGALQVITRTMDAGTQNHQILSKVEVEVRRLNALVTDLLAFARPGSASLHSVDLKAVASEVVAMLTTDAPAVRFSVDGEGSASADENLLRQILHNLLRNAVDAVDGTGRVAVQLAPGRVVVADSGPGIPEDSRDRIFEPFMTTKTRGTGLGLAISTRAADAMGASLRLIDGPLSGAAFEVRLAD